MKGTLDRLLVANMDQAFSVSVTNVLKDPDLLKY